MSQGDSSQSNFDAYLRRARQDRQQIRVHPPLDPARRARMRWVAGLLIGSCGGLAFGLVSQVGNRLLLHGLPVFQPPFGWLSNLVMYAVLMAMLGISNAWSEKTQNRVLFAFAGLLVLYQAVR